MLEKTSDTLGRARLLFVVDKADRYEAMIGQNLDATISL